MEYDNETLVDMYRNDEDANKRELLSELYRRNYPIICKICRNFSRGNEADYEDYLQESYFGLLIAVERYDASQGSKFMSFAEVCIRSTLSRYANSNQTVSLPANVLSAIGRYNRACQSFYMMHGRDPKDTEVMELLGINGATLDRIKRYIDAVSACSLDSGIAEGLTLIDTVEDPEDAIGDVNDHFDFEIFKADLWTAVDELDGKKPQILRKRFQEGKTYGQIGEEMEITAERVRQLQNKALSRLSRSSKLKIYRDDYILSHAYHGCGSQAFHNTGTSSTEKAAIDLYEYSMQEKMAKLNRRIKRIAKKNNVTAEQAFSIYIREKYADIL